MRRKGYGEEKDGFLKEKDVYWMDLRNFSTDL